jgi:hypothetical protein
MAGVALRVMQELPGHRTRQTGHAVVGFRAGGLGGRNVCPDFRMEGTVERLACKGKDARTRK